MEVYSQLQSTSHTCHHLIQVSADRHPGVMRFCRTEKPGIKHWFDVWHVAKGLKKKLQACCRIHTFLEGWIVSIIDHLYWVAAMGRGDGDLVVSMWNSLLNVCNKHNGHEGPYQKCIHGPLEKRLWMKQNSKRPSKSYRKL
ncbi:uncharacterized protein LOC144128843 isoform X2 [Amblyomma americanum]